MVDADMVSCCLHAFALSLFVADLIVGMEGLELHYRCRGRSYFRKIRIAATISWPRGSTGVQRYGCIPPSAANNLGEIPEKLGAPNPLF